MRVIGRSAKSLGNHLTESSPVTKDDYSGNPFNKSVIQVYRKQSCGSDKSFATETDKDSSTLLLLFVHDYCNVLQFLTSIYELHDH